MNKNLIFLSILLCVTLNVFAAKVETGYNSRTQTTLDSQNHVGLYTAKGFKGGRRGGKMGPSSKRKDPNQVNSGNNRGKEHITHQTENNRQKHEPAEARRNKEQGESDEKNERRHKN
jgi:hypothetical protein